MKFGLCTGGENAPIVAEAGYDYIELSAVNDLEPFEHDDGQISDLSDYLRRLGLRGEACNQMVPGDLPVVGPDRDLDALKWYMATVCSRAARMGGKVVVFGSAGARRVPDGYDYDTAFSEMAEFLAAIADIASSTGIMIAIESLNTRESNMVTSVGEAIRLAHQVARPDSIAVLSDLYHVQVDGQIFDETVQAASAGLLAHVHVACGLDRHAPRSEDHDELARFFTALRVGGYDGRISVESNWTDMAAEAPVALEVMRAAWG